MNKISQEEISQTVLNVIKSTGEFIVYPNYRDEKYRRACRFLKKKGVLRQTGYGIRETYVLA